MDEHVPRAITASLRVRGVNVLTAQEDGYAGRMDPDLLDRATALGRVLFTRDEDFLKEGALRQRHGTTFAGVVYADQLEVSVGKCVKDLETICLAGEPQDLEDRVERLPL
jgi:predicted nuclease of predicted toxin-antitoxin system